MTKYLYIIQLFYMDFVVTFHGLERFCILDFFKTINLKTF